MLLFQIIVAVAGTAFLAQGLLNILSLYTVYAMSTNALRLSALVLRNGSVAVTTPNLAGMGPMYSGCRQLHIQTTWTYNRTTMSVCTAAPMLVEGFWLVTAASQPEEDPISYNLDIFSEGSWKRIVTPPWVLESQMYDIPLQRSALKTVDLRPPAAWVLISCVGIPAFSLACYASCAMGLAGQGRRGALAISFGFLVLATMQLIWTLYATVTRIGFDVNGGWDSLNVVDTTVWAAWLFFVCSLLLAVTAYYERYTLDAFLVVFTLIGTGMVYDTRDRATSTESELYRAVVALIWSILPAATLGLLILGRYFTRRWILCDFLSADRMLYDTIWADVLSEDHTVGALSNLAGVVESVSSTIRPGECRQYQRCFSGSDPRTWSAFQTFRLHSFRRDTSGTKTDGTFRAPISSLDQLMEQATCLNIFLKKKVKELVLKCGGAIQVLTGGEKKVFERYTEFSHNQHDWAWAAVKPSERALEKLLRSYDCDVSRLLDCCRQTIAFDTVSDLQRCLLMITTDSELEVVQIKNMLDKKNNSWKTGGFR